MIVLAGRGNLPAKNKIIKIIFFYEFRETFL